MSESDNNGDKTLTVAPSKTLHLKPRTTEQGMVRQSFSHGRSKVVVVEKVRRRAPGGSETSKPAAAAVPPTAAPTPPAPPPPTKPETKRPAAPRAASGVVLRELTDDEREARARALVDARSREDEDRKRAEIEARARTEREAREHEERAAASARKREEEERLAREAESRRKSEEEARRRLPQDGAASEPTGTKTASRAPQAEPAAKRGPVRTIGGFAQPTPPRPTPSRGGEMKNRSRLTVTTATSGEGEERMRSVASFRRRVQRLKGMGTAEPKKKSVAKSFCLKPSRFKNSPTVCLNAAWMSFVCS